MRDKAHNGGSTLDNVLWDLNADHDGALLARLRAAAPFAPPKQRDVVNLVLALHATPTAPATLARTTRDPDGVLGALRYLNPHDPVKRHQRLAAAAILAERLAVAPDGRARHAAIAAACNVWNDGPETDRIVAKLPAAARARLARLAEGMLAKASGEGTSRWATAFRFVTTCGDRACLPAIDAAAARAIAQRRANRQPLRRPLVWEQARAAIERRVGG